MQPLLASWPFARQLRQIGSPDVATHTLEQRKCDGVSRVAVVSLLVVIATTCSPPSSPESRTPNASTRSAPTDSVEIPTSTPGAELRVDGYDFGAEDVYVRPCETQLFGGERLGPGAEPEDRIGPIVLSGLSAVDLFDADELVSDSADELKILKFPTELAGPRPVWLAISPEDRSRASLIYDSSRWGTQTGRLPLIAGDPVVAFESCHDGGGYTQYNGGILVAGPICITLEVWEGDPDREPIARSVAFGTGTQCE